MSATPPASAARPTASGSASTTSPASTALADRPGGRDRGGERLLVGGAHERAGAGQQLLARARGGDPAAADDHELVGDHLDLGQQVRGQQHGPAAVGEVAQQRAHPAHALGVEPVGGLVEDQHLGVAEQRVREPEPLAHAERVLAHPLAARPSGRARRAPSSSSARFSGTPISRAESASVSRPRRPGCCAEASSRMPTRRPGLGSVPVGAAEHGGAAGVGLGEPAQHAQRGGLAGAVGAEEPRHGARLAGERHVLDHGAPAESLREPLRLDHGRKDRGRPASGHGPRPLRRDRGRRRSTSVGGRARRARTYDARCHDDPGRPGGPLAALAASRRARRRRRRAALRRATGRSTSLRSVVAALALGIVLLGDPSDYDDARWMLDAALGLGVDRRAVVAPPLPGRGRGRHRRSSRSSPPPPAAPR